MTERFEATTTVRRPRVLLMWGLIAVMLAFGIATSVLRGLFHGFHAIGPLPFWLIGPAIAAVQRRPKIETLAVSASPDGLVLGGKIVPRAKLQSALLRREHDRTWVLLRGGATWNQVDVEVPNDESADRLCAALALDAKSTTAEFRGFHKAQSNVPMLLGFTAAAVGIGVLAIAFHHMLVPMLVFGLAMLAFVVGLPLLFYSRQTKLRVGADGIVVKQGFANRQFIGHDDIASVRANGAQVIIERKHGEPMTFAVANEVGKKQVEDQSRQAQSIAWRIEKAREAYAALAGEAPQAALALDRGQRTVREWIEQLRRVGQGANATFRDVGLTREQLLAVVESTTAAAKERLAAAVALRDGLTEEEKPRIRVAADRCVEPAMRERMVRVAFASDDDELIEALSDADVAAQR